MCITFVFSPVFCSLDNELDFTRGRVWIGGQLLQEEAVDIVQGDVEPVHGPQNVTDLKLGTDFGT